MLCCCGSEKGHGLQCGAGGEEDSGQVTPNSWEPTEAQHTRPAMNKHPSTHGGPGIVPSTGVYKDDLGMVPVRQGAEEVTGMERREQNPGSFPRVMDRTWQSVVREECADGGLGGLCQEAVWLMRPFTETGTVRSRPI